MTLDEAIEQIADLDTITVGQINKWARGYSKSPEDVLKAIEHERQRRNRVVRMEAPPTVPPITSDDIRAHRAKKAEQAEPVPPEPMEPK